MSKLLTSFDAVLFALLFPGAGPTFGLLFGRCVKFLTTDTALLKFVLCHVVTPASALERCKFPCGKK